MDNIIQSYLDSSDAFNRLAGDDGLIDVRPYLEHSRLLEIVRADGRGRPFDADDLKSIGAVFMNLADKLKERGK